MAKMNSALKWTLIIGGLGVTGVVGYFVYKKIKEMQQKNAQNEEAKNNSSVSEIEAQSHAHNRRATPSGDEIEKLPFKNSTEGNAFRKWVNDNYPNYAKKIKLDPTGKYNNSYILKAWKEYGSIYQEENNNVTSVKYSQDFANLLSKWKKPLLINKSGTPYFKVGLKPKGMGCVLTLYVFDRKDSGKVGSAHFFKIYDNIFKKNRATGEWSGDLSSFKIATATAGGYAGTTLSGGQNIADKLSQMLFGSTGKITWC